MHGDFFETFIGLRACACVSDERWDIPPGCEEAHLDRSYTFPSIAGNTREARGNHVRFCMDQLGKLGAKRAARASHCSSGFISKEHQPWQLLP
jgi:hypothetical protein